MADYNIYIHNLDGGNGGGSGKTTPWSDGEGNETTPWRPQPMEVINTAQNPDSLISKGVSFVAKAIPAVAIAMAVVKLCTQVTDTVTSFVTTESGDYRWQTNYENFKNVVRRVFTPFSSTISDLQNQQRIRIENTKREQQRALFGESVIDTGIYGV